MQEAGWEFHSTGLILLQAVGDAAAVWVLAWQIISTGLFLQRTAEGAECHV